MISDLARTRRESATFDVLVANTVERESRKTIAWVPLVALSAAAANRDFL